MYFSVHKEQQSVLSNLDQNLNYVTNFDKEAECYISGFSTYTQSELSQQFTHHHSKTVTCKSRTAYFAGRRAQWHLNLPGYLSMTLFLTVFTTLYA
jgi:hypothetical protein